MSSVTPTTLPIEPTTSSLSTPDGLTDILSQAQQKLQQAAASSDLFVQVFGEKANSQELMAVQTAWAIGDFSLFPQVQILPMLTSTVPTVPMLLPPKAFTCQNTCCKVLLPTLSLGVRLVF